MIYSFLKIKISVMSGSTSRKWRQIQICNSSTRNPAIPWQLQNSKVPDCCHIGASLSTYMIYHMNHNLPGGVSGSGLYSGGLTWSIVLRCDQLTYWSHMYFYVRWLRPGPVLLTFVCPPRHRAWLLIFFAQKNTPLDRPGFETWPFDHKAGTLTTTISNTRATFAYHSFCDNLRLQCTSQTITMVCCCFSKILNYYLLRKSDVTK